MYERSYGSKYPNEYLSAADIAKLMRADIKQAINADKLPGVMTNYSVRVHNYSGGRRINITARDLPDMWEDCDGIEPGSKVPFANGNGWTATNCGRYEHKQGHTHRRLTSSATAILDVLQEIHRAYNHNGSEVQVDYFDVNYYGSADIEDEWHAKFRASEVARKKARRAMAN